MVRTCVVREKRTGRSRGFGFVQYADQASALEALTAKNGFEVMDYKIKVGVAKQSKDDQLDYCKLFVSNIPPAYTESDMESLFRRVCESLDLVLFGTIHDDHCLMIAR